MMVTRKGGSGRKLTGRKTAKVLIVLLVLPSVLPAICKTHCGHWKGPKKGWSSHQKHSTSQSREDEGNQGYSKVHSNMVRASKVTTAGINESRHWQPIFPKYGRPSPPPPPPWQGTVILTPVQNRNVWRSYHSTPPPYQPVTLIHRGANLSPKLQRNEMKPSVFGPPPGKKKSLTCPGRKNLLDDIGVLSLLTAAMSSTFGLYTILVNSMTSNSIGIVSGFLSLVLWLPSTLITLFDLTGHHIQLASNLLNSMSFVNSMYGFMGVVFGTADVLASAAGESVGIISLILSIIATFPDFLDGIIDYLYRNNGPEKRRSLEYFVDNYGCSVPGIFRLVGKPLYNRVNDFLVQVIAGKQRRRDVTLLN